MEDQKTDNKILLAAERLFTEKGFSATRMRDIATAAEVNLALINYHYKSKENLFSIVMHQKVKQLLETMIPYLNRSDTSLEEKIDIIVAELYKVIATDQNLPLFVFGELQKKDVNLAKIVPAYQIKNSVFLAQIKERNPDIMPMHFALNLLSLVFHPYIMAPLLMKVKITTQAEIVQLLQERIKLIPIWAKQMLK